MKHTKDPSPLAASDPEIARLFASLDADAPPPDAEASILARLESSRPLPPQGPLVNTWVLRGGVVVTGILGVLIALRMAPGHDSAPIATPSVVSVAADAPPAPQVETPHVAVEDLPAAPSANVARPSPRAAGVEAKDSFREQLALVESARHSLAGGDAQGCLTTLRRYDTTYPAGLFTTEVGLVRIDALVAAGQPERAEALARDVLTSDPHGAYADRLHSLFPQIGRPDQ